MDNKSNCGCGCGGKSRFRLVLFTLAIIVLAVVGISQVLKEDSSEQQPIAPANATEAVEATETSSLPFILEPQKVSEAELIPITLLSVNLAEVEGGKLRTILIAPTVDWQGDFSAARIVATMLATYKSDAGQADIVDIYFLPLGLESEEMYDEVALGRLLVDAKNSKDNLLLTVTRGYLPQELDFMEQWSKMSPEFMQAGALNKEALTQALIEKSGVDAHDAKSYPFLKAKPVENLGELLEGDAKHAGNF